MRNTLILGANPFTVHPAALGGMNKLTVVIGYAAWLAIAVCLIGLIAAGAKTAIAHHNGEAMQMGSIGKVVLGCLIVGGAGSLAAAVTGFNLFSSSPQAIPGLTMVQTIVNAVAWTAAGICVIGLIFAGAKMAMAHRHGEPIGGMLGGVFIGCLVVGASGTIVGALLP
jgi:hypothetical protein